MKGGEGEREMERVLVILFVGGCGLVVVLGRCRILGWLLLGVFVFCFLF